MQQVWTEVLGVMEMRPVPPSYPLEAGCPLSCSHPQNPHLSLLPDLGQGWRTLKEDTCGEACMGRRV